MGSISYDGTVVEFEDRLVAHLQIVIVQKFRARESFLMSWLDPLRIGDGRSAVWLTPGSPMHFEFVGSRSPAIDREWLDLLTRSAESGSGLVVMNERGELVHATNQHEVGRFH
jgi:hypothetical protein